MHFYAYPVSNPLKNMEWGWLGSDLPFRWVNRTYAIFPYETLPPVPIEHEFSHITSVAQIPLVSDLIHPSPTACHWHLEPPVFYKDQQDCCSWAVDSKGRVYCPNLFNRGTHLYVAKSLADFLWRINQENKNWSFVYEVEDYLLWAEEEWQNDYIGHYQLLLQQSLDWLIRNNCCNQSCKKWLLPFFTPVSMLDYSKNFRLTVTEIKKLWKSGQDISLDHDDGKLLSLSSSTVYCK